MAKTLNTDMDQDLLKPNTPGTWLWLCEIAVPNSQTRRFSDGVSDIVYDSNTYEPIPMSVGNIGLVSDGSLPRITLQVSNIQRAIEDLLNDSSGMADADIQLVKVNDRFLDSAISALEADYDVLMSESDEDWVIFTLGAPDLLSQRFPLRDYSSSLCPWASPSLFKGIRCGYSGGDSSCTGTFGDCTTKGNAARWGGDLGLDPSVMEI